MPVEPASMEGQRDRDRRRCAIHCVQAVTWRQARIAALPDGRRQETAQGPICTADIVMFPGCEGAQGLRCYGGATTLGTPRSYKTSRAGRCFCSTVPAKGWMGIAVMIQQFRNRLPHLLPNCRAVLVAAAPEQMHALSCDARRITFRSDEVCRNVNQQRVHESPPSSMPG